MKVIQYRVLVIEDPSTNSGADRYEFVTVAARNLTSGIGKAVARARELCGRGEVVVTVEFWQVLSEDRHAHLPRDRDDTLTYSRGIGSGAVHQRVRP